MVCTGSSAPADAARSLARAAHDGADLAGLLGDERRDDVALAELDGPDDERLALEQGHPTCIAAGRRQLCDSSAGMS